MLRQLRNAPRSAVQPEAFYSEPVKKLLAFVVISVMLTQSVWAAVSGACGHPQGWGPQVQHEQHFGHHAHAGQDSAHTGSNEAGTPGASELQHQDCGACHLVHSPAIATSQTAFPAAPADSLVSVALIAPKADWVPSGIERPNWRT